MGAFVIIPGAGKDDLVLEIALGLPDVAGMRLDDVNDQESDALVVLFVEFIESGNLPPEGWSSVAAEDQHDGLVRRQSGELHMRGLVERGQREVRSGVAGMELTGTGVGPHGFKGNQDICD